MAHFVGIEQAVAALQGAVTEETERGMVRACQMVADEAAANHDYENRTGRLQSRTVPGRVTTSGHRVTGLVLGDTRYGKYIEEGTKNADGSERIRPRKFLEKAAERRSSGIAAEFDIALGEAARRAGWGR